MVQKPRKSQADQGAASVLRDFLQPVDGVKGACVPVSILIHSILIESSTFRDPRLRVLAGQQPSGQRIGGKCTDAVCLCHRQETLPASPPQEGLTGVRNINTPGG